MERRAPIFCFPGITRKPQFFSQEGHDVAAAEVDVPGDDREAVDGDPFAADLWEGSEDGSPDRPAPHTVLLDIAGLGGPAPCQDVPGLRVGLARRCGCHVASRTRSVIGSLLHGVGRGAAADQCHHTRGPAHSGFPHD